MTTQTYNEKLRDPRWQARRLRVFERDHFACRSCNDTKTELQVHHLKYTGEPWDAPDDALISLCKHCHMTIEGYKNSYDFIGHSFKIVRDDVVFLAIPGGDCFHLFKIQFGIPRYLISFADNILKEFVHHVINWWLKTEKEENLNLYKSIDHGQRPGIPILP